MAPFASPDMPPASDEGMAPDIRRHVASARSLKAASVVRTTAAARTLAETALPAFADFTQAVSNGRSGVVRGVYVPGLLALRVIQQPAGDSTFVSTVTRTATQLQAAPQGVVGLAAHNFASGALFAGLSLGQEVRLVYGDGADWRYTITAILRYQALEPDNPYGVFVNLNSETTLSAQDLFAQVYTGSRHLTLQTCIARDGLLNWGRLFVIATPTQ